MGATDEEMALLERLAEPVEITDLDKPKTPPPSSPPPQEQTNETVHEVNNGKYFYIEVFINNLNFFLIRFVQHRQHSSLLHIHRSQSSEDVMHYCNAMFVNVDLWALPLSEHI